MRNTSEKFLSGSKTSLSSSIFWCILISRYFELDRETAKFSCNKVYQQKFQNIFLISKFLFSKVMKVANITSLFIWQISITWKAV